MIRTRLLSLAFVLVMYPVLGLSAENSHDFAFLLTDQLQRLEAQLDAESPEKRFDWAARTRAVTLLVQLERLARERGGAESEALLERVAELRARLERGGKKTEKAREPMAQALDGLTGSFRGRVLDEGGAPLELARVEITPNSGNFVENLPLDASGVYMSSALPPGLYKIAARATGYISEVFDNVPCPSRGCDLGLGTSVALDPDEVEVIDFVLDDGASIAGRVIDQATGVGIAGIPVIVPSNEALFAQLSREDGSYRISGLEAGTHHILAETYAPEYASEVYRDVPRHLYDGTNGTPIVLGSDTHVEDIVLDLVRRGEIKGQVRRIGSLAPLAIGRVMFFRAGFLSYPEAEAIVVDGHYRSPGLARGTYLVAVADSPGSIGQVHPGINCQIPFYSLGSCDPAAATLIEVEDGTSHRVDFVLEPGSTFQGRVLDARTLLPLANAQLVAYGPDRFALAATTTTTDGRYQLSGLARGSYALEAHLPGYLNQVYPNYSCWQCSQDRWPRTEIGADQALTGIDFGLEIPGSILGFVRDRQTRTPIANARVVLLDEQDYSSQEIYTDSSGFFAFHGLPALGFWLGADSSEHLPNVFDGLSVDVLDATTLDDGRQLEVVPGSSVAVTDLLLERGGSISGLAGGGSYCPLLLFDARGVFVTQSYADFEGKFRFAGLPDGSYRLLARCYGQAALVFPDRACLSLDSYDLSQSCDLVSGAALRIENGGALQRIDFPSTPSGSIIVTLSNQSPSFASNEVEAYDSQRRSIGKVQFYGGQYFLGPLPEGQYFLRFSADGSMPRLYPNIECTPQGCPFDQAQTVTVEAGMTKNIDLDARPQVPRPCFANAETLCLNDRRFEVTTTWRDAEGQSGKGQKLDLTEDSGAFWFFSPGNTEVLVKVLNACADPFNRFWVYAAGLTDVEVTLKVRDTLTEESKEYRSRLGQPFSPVLDTVGFDSCAARPASGAEPLRVLAIEPDSAPPAVEVAASHSGFYLCETSANGLCLREGRFKVQVKYRTGAGASGNAAARQLTAEAGVFTFFDRDNVELIVKLLDGCAINGYNWVLVSGLTDVEVDLRIDDTSSGDSWVFHKNLGQPFAPIFNLEVFGCRSSPIW